MDRAEATGFGVAFAGHAALLAALSLGLATARMPTVQSDPIEVSFVDEVALESMAPNPSNEAPAPLLAPEPGPAEPASAPPEPLPQPPAAMPPPQPRVAERPQPPAPQPLAARPQPKSSPPQKAVPPKAGPAQGRTNSASRPTGRLSGLLTSLGDSEGKAAAPPASAAGPAVAASLAAELRRQLKPHWKSPTGADAELLRTEVELWLSESGGVSRLAILRTSGQTASNRPQVRLHQEQAERAVRLAAPFRLPPHLYEAWKHVTVTFDKRLSQ